MEIIYLLMAQGFSTQIHCVLLQLPTVHLQQYVEITCRPVNYSKYINDLYMYMHIVKSKQKTKLQCILGYFSTISLTSSSCCICSSNLTVISVTLCWSPLAPAALRRFRISWSSFALNSSEAWSMAVSWSLRI